MSLGAALATGSGGLARAADWSLAGVFSQTTTYDDNRGLSVVPAGPVLGAADALSLTLTGKTPASLLSFNTSLSYPLYAGAGAAGLERRLRISLSSNYQHKLARDTFTLYASLVPASTTETELTDSGAIVVDATRWTVQVGGSDVHAIDQLTSVTLSALAMRVDFTGNAGSLKPYTSLSASTLWSRQLTRRTSATATLGWLTHNPDDPSLPDTNTLSGTLGLSSALTKQLSLAAALGWRHTVSGESGSAGGIVGNLSLTYKQKNTTYALTAAETVAPSSLGVVQTTTSLGASVTHRINDRSQLSLSVSFSSFASEVQPDRRVLVIAPTYSFQATRNITGRIGYRFTQRFGGAGDATSNAFTFGFSSDLAIKP